MSISAAHSNAARQNGKLSHGPVSPSGKARSSQNARKHDLLGSIALLSCEDRAGFDAIADAFIQEYLPETPTEIHFVREMADAEFRLQRVRSHAATIHNARMSALSENPTMDDAAEAFRQLADEGPSLQLLLRYENQFRRQFEKSLQLLLDCRLRRRTDRDRMMKAQADAYIQFAQDLVDLPMPSAPAEAPLTGPKKSESSVSQPAGIKFPNEPNPSHRQSPPRQSKISLFTKFFSSAG
jgi:hypothetical protein